MTKLYILTGPDKEQVRDLEGDVISVGRSKDNDIIINDSSISRNHLQILKKEDRYVIKDLGSTNGSYFKNEKLIPHTEVEITNGEPICIGEIILSLGKSYSGNITALQESIDPSTELVKTGKYIRPVAAFKNLELLYKVATVLMESLDLNEILEKILDYIFDFLKRINRGVIILIDETGKTSEVISKSRENGDKTGPTYSRTIVNQVIREGQAIIMTDTRQEDKADLSDSIERMNIRSIMCVPLISKSKTRGVVYVDTLKKPSGFRKEDLTILTALSSPAAVAIENALLYSKTKRAEEALKKARDRLEDQVKERNDELLKANALLKQEIIERKQAEKALQESEEKYRNLYNNAPVGLFRTEVSNGKILEANAHAAKLFGYDKLDEFTSECVFADHYVDPGVREKLLSELREKGEVRDFEAQFSRKDGSSIWARYYARINPEKGYMEGVTIDITQQKKLETQFQQAQRMEAIGTLAGGVAHDFNNLLMAIQGRATLMLMDTLPSEPHYKHLKGIEESVSSATTLTKQLLGFARGGKYEVKPSDPNEIVAKSSELFGRTKKEISILSKFQKKIRIVEVDPGQIEQVLLNLYVNALHAMPGGGELRLETKNVALDANFVKPFFVKPGKYVKISVTDTGEGMDEKTRQRIFDPFFTTKAMGRGTGLGLASAYSIIKNHGGIINVTSKKGKGSTFDIYLPASEKQVIETERLSEEIVMGRETVLLVDDEEMVIQVGKQMLEKLGYKVLIAKSGKKAIDVYNKKKNKIDMVILDLIMPDMGGGETYSKLKEINPDIKVLLSSGYSIDGSPKEIMDQGCNGFVQKPFNMNDLSKNLKEILG